MVIKKMLAVLYCWEAGHARSNIHVPLSWVNDSTYLHMIIQRCVCAGAPAQAILLGTPGLAFVNFQVGKK